jgi:hypothetical protein
MQKKIKPKFMTPRPRDKSEQVFTKLTTYGYSERVAETIWQWYHPSDKVATN